MKHSIEQLRNNNQSKEDFVFFRGHHEKPGKITKACFSQWYPCEFEMDGQTYNCAEQYMMAEKARVFGDEEVRQQILAESDQQTIKKLGRLVKNYDDAKWAAVRYDVVVKGNLHKFAQNIDLWHFLHDTGGRILVEASPYDRIWGIGMDEHNPDAIHPEEWKGSNLLGFALMEVCENLLAE